MKRTRRNHGTTFKVQVTLAAVKGDKTLHAKIDRTHPLPVVWQCQLLGVACSTAYYQLTPMADSERALMRRIDELHLQYPFAGARMLGDLLRQDSHAIGWRRVARLMRCIGITAVYRKLLHPCLPNLSLSPAPHGGHTLQAVWAADISAPCRRGWRKTNYAGWLPIGSWSAALNPSTSVNTTDSRCSR